MHKFYLTNNISFQAKNYIFRLQAQHDINSILSTNFYLKIKKNLFV